MDKRGALYNQRTLVKLVFTLQPWNWVRNSEFARLVSFQRILNHVGLDKIIFVVFSDHYGLPLVLIGLLVCVLHYQAFLNSRVNSLDFMLYF